MMGGSNRNYNPNPRPHRMSNGGPSETGGKSMASQKFDAIFGGPSSAQDIGAAGS